MHIHRHHPHPLLLAVILILPTALFAADSLTPTAFVDEASASGAAEVQLAQLALRNGESAQVKQFAQQMIQDHSKANDELAGLARRKNLATQPPGPDAQAAMKQLQVLSGTSFDHAFAATMVKDHVKAVDLFRRASQSLTDGELQQFAASTLPTLEHHLEMARALPQG